MYNASLKNKTWTQTGGTVFKYIECEHINEISDIIKCYKGQKKVFTAGNSSNCIFSDRYLDIVILKLGKYFDGVMDINSDVIRIGGATKVYAKYKDILCKNGIGGLEFMCSIPGTVGGMVAMNAGCYGMDISKCCKRICYIDINGDIKIRETQSPDFSYRKNNIKDIAVIIWSEFYYYNSCSDVIMTKINKNLKQRQETQIQRFTTGSTFKNVNNNISAWSLLKKHCIDLDFNGAIFSKKHFNFITKTSPKTSSNDFINLINCAKKIVKKESGIDLDQEVILIN